MLVALLSGCATTAEIPPLAKQSYNLGNALSRLGEYGNAENAYLTALKQYPEYRDAGYNLTLLYIHQQEYKKALDAIDPFTGDESFIELEAFLAAESGDTDRALELYEVLYERDRDPSWQVERIKILVNSESFQEAKAVAQQMIADQVTHPDIYYMLGRIEEISEQGDGIGWYSSAFLADPGHDAALEKLLDFYDTQSGDQVLRRELDTVLEASMAEHPENQLLQFYRGRNLLLTGERSGLEFLINSYGDDEISDQMYLDLYDRLSDLYPALAADLLGELERLDVVRIVTIEADQP
jgi:tetratricopeptide (TPR) repeat protein